MAKEKDLVPPEKLSDEFGRELRHVLNKESDLASILIVTSFADECLRTLLGKHLIESAIAESLLKHTGVLGSFDARASLAYCLGLITKGMFKNLRTLGEMRNKVAHARIMLSFNDADVAELCAKLSLPTVRRQVVSGLAAGEEESNWLVDSEHPRIRFTLVSVMLLMRLIMTTLDANRSERCVEGWE